MSNHSMTITNYWCVISIKNWHTSHFWMKCRKRTFVCQCHTMAVSAKYYPKMLRHFCIVQSNLVIRTFWSSQNCLLINANCSRAEILEIISVVFWKKLSFHKDIIKLNDLYQVRLYTKLKCMKLLPRCKFILFLMAILDCK